MTWSLDRVPDARRVCDPFMGAGSAGVACAAAGREFVGIERERRFFDAACERIERAYAQGQFFAPEASKPIQQEIAA
jgi:site-specific DNA-methyltransferase (adenine-specific)